MKILYLLLLLLHLTHSLPQWPYRDNYEYYGYQRRPTQRSVEDDDDEGGVVMGNKGRQDLKVAEVQQPPAQTPVVLETGSAKPVSIEKVAAPVATQQSSPAETKVATQPQAQSPQAVQPPAFPPASPPQRPPNPNSNPGEDESEEDSEEEEADEDDEEDEEDDSDRRRSDNVANATSVETENNENNKNVVEALVPGYVTEQGEVLVPFDTVVGDKSKVVAVLEDPTYKNTPPQQPPVVIIPSSSPSSPPTPPPPKFFTPQEHRQLYYSDVPPPGSIFTFDEDDNELIKKSRSDSSEENDDASEEEEDVDPRPPLAWVKASAPSGEDDEAESLGIRLARRNGFYGSRTPQLFLTREGYYVARYPREEETHGNRYYGNFPGYYNNQRPIRRNSGNHGNQKIEQVYYYRPTSSQPVRVTPIGSFDVSLEEDGENVRPVVGPFHYYKRNKPTPVTKQRQAKQLKKKNIKKVQEIKKKN